MGAFVSQAILLASFLGLVGAEESPFVFNLESVVKKYVEDYAARHDTTFLFYDMWAKHHLMQERGVYRSVAAAVRVRWIQYENWTLKRRLQDAENNYDYMCSQYKGVALQALTTSMSSLLGCRGKFKGYKLKVTASNFEFGEAIGEHTRPTEVFTTTYTNEQETDAIHTVTQTYINTESSSIKLERGFESKYKTSIDVGVPGIISAGGEFSFQYTLNKTTFDTKSKTETLSIEVQVAVPSKKTVQVTWYVINKVMDFPWTATVTVRGWFAFWLNRQVHGHYLWFQPVSALAVIDYNLTAVDSHTVTFEASGVFRKIATLDSRVFVYELRRFERAKPTTTRQPKPLIMPPVLE